jgi:cytochrome c-type biogenesis protein CcmH
MPTTSDIGEKVPGAERLEGRLLAPCCWAQTLDIHGSEIANELRREIRTRLKAGESPGQIEQSLIARYGERMRAVPDKVPLNTMGTMGWFGVAASAGFLVYMLRQWRKRSLAGQGSTNTRNTGARPAEASDERLESELRRIQDT